MKNSIWFVLGIVLYVIMTLIDRLFFMLDDTIYILGVIIAIIFMVIGHITARR